MHFAFTEQQEEFRQAVRQVLAKECTTDRLRAAYDAPAARTPRWATLAGLGVTGLSVPEAYGGLGLGLVDLVLLLEEAGAVGLPEPLVDTTALAAPLLVGVQTAGHGAVDTPRDQRASRLDAWLAGIADGTVTAAVGPVPHGTHPVPIAGADGADLLVLYSTGDGDTGAEVHVVEAGAVTVRTVSSLDPTRRLGIPHWAPTADTLVLSGPPAAAAIRSLTDRAAVAVGAELLGLTSTMIDTAAEYARERRQFGAPIGSFQAVKHLLAGARVALEFARPVVYAAAWSLDHHTDDASRSASVAKAYASDAAVEAARVSLQVHGAIGYTWECDLQLFLKRAWALSESWGSAAEHRRRVLDSLVEDRVGVRGA
jgi:hypothetical protein